MLPDCVDFPSPELILWSDVEWFSMGAQRSNKQREERDYRKTGSGVESVHKFLCHRNLAYTTSYIQFIRNPPAKFISPPLIIKNSKRCSRKQAMGVEPIIRARLRIQKQRRTPYTIPDFPFTIPYLSTIPPRAHRTESIHSPKNTSLKPNL